MEGHDTEAGGRGEGGHDAPVGAADCEKLVAFVRDADRPCTEEELLALLAQPPDSGGAPAARHLLHTLVESGRLETQVVRFDEGDEQRMYWLSTVGTTAATATGTSSASGEMGQTEKESLESLRSRLRELEDQIAQHAVHESDYDKEIAQHMERVHDYNELKDIAQALMGRLATIEGVLTRDLYKRYGLDLED